MPPNGKAHGVPVRLIAVIAMLLTALVSTVPAASAAETTPGETLSVSESASLEGMTTGGVKTFISASPAFEQFDASLGTLTSARLSWALDGSANGTRNAAGLGYAGTAVLSYGGASQTRSFDTDTNPGPKTFDFDGSTTMRARSSMTGTGTWIPSGLTGTIEHSGYFPWSGSMTASGTVTLVYEYVPAGTDTTAPALSNLPADIAVEATGPSGAPVTYAAPTATDAVGVTEESCSPASGTTFALGTTTVTCTAADAAGNRASGTFTVTVQDTTAPALSDMPTDITAEATAPFGANVAYTDPTATDAVGVTGRSCSPVSGSTFGFGTTTVSCSARDGAGNIASDTFTVTVQDTIAPTLTGLPADITAEATGPSGAPVTFTAPTATDAVGVTETSCSPASGATFALGATTVTCTAADAAGNSTSDTLVVTVTDTTAPVLSNLLADMTVDATGLSGATVHYTTPTATDAVGVASPSCTPRSGTTFALGTTTITCTAADAAGNSTSDTSTVTVQVGARGIDTLVDVVKTSGLRSGVVKSLLGPLSQAQALADDGNPGNDGAVCNKLDEFVVHVAARVADRSITPALGQALTSFASGIKASRGC